MQPSKRGRRGDDRHAHIHTDSVPPAAPVVSTILLLLLLIILARETVRSLRAAPLWRQAMPGASVNIVVSDLSLAENMCQSLKALSPRLLIYEGMTLFALIVLTWLCILLLYVCVVRLMEGVPTALRAEFFSLRHLYVSLVSLSVCLFCSVFAISHVSHGLSGRLSRRLYERASHLRRLFSEMDKDNDGCITHAELRAGLAHFLRGVLLLAFLSFLEDGGCSFLQFVLVVLLWFFFCVKSTSHKCGCVVVSWLCRLPTRKRLWI